MRPVISYRCEGAGGERVGEGDHVAFRGISRRQQITRTDFDCRSTANEGRSLQSLGGWEKKENFTAKHVYGVRAHVSIVHFFCLIL